MGMGHTARSRQRQVRLTAALLIGFVASACASGVNNPLDRGAEYRLAEDHRVEVTNRNWDDMQIFAVHGSATYRLGSVSGHSSREFRLPVSLAGRAGGLRLAARPRGGKNLHYSELIQLAPGQLLGWTLEPNLKLSFHWVR